jgi:hypothetical protein
MILDYGIPSENVIVFCITINMIQFEFMLWPVLLLPIPNHQHERIRYSAFRFVSFSKIAFSQSIKEKLIFTDSPDSSLINSWGG